MHYYRLDLNKCCFSNEITWRKFLVLVRELPNESSYFRWMKNEDNRKFAQYDEEQINENVDKMR